VIDQHSLLQLKCTWSSISPLLWYHCTRTVQSINQSIKIFSVAQIANYYWDHKGVYGETIECEGMICEREMTSAGGGKRR